MQLLGIIGFFLAIIGAFHFMSWGALLLSDHISDYQSFLPFVAFFIIFLVILIGVNLIGKGMKSILDLTLLGSFDDLAGAIAGLLKWALVLSIFIWIFDSFQLIAMDQYYEEATLFPLVASLAPFLFDSLSFLLPYFQELNGPRDLPRA